MKLLERMFPKHAARQSIAHLYGQVWVMEPGAVEAFLDELHALRNQLAASGELAAAMGRARAAGGEEDPLEVVDGIARIRVEGPIVKQVPGWARYYGVRMCGTSDVQRQLAAALEDPGVKGMLLVVDSPGGTISGVQELGDALFAARAKKPIHGYGSDLAASAGYWLLSQASRISANKSASIGSIGVFSVAYDASRMVEDAGFKVHVIRTAELKGAGTFGAPITEAQLANWQKSVNGALALFEEAIARGRGLDAAATHALATGACWYAAEAQTLKLIDAVESLDVAHAEACAICDQPPALTPPPPPTEDARRGDAAITEDAPPSAEGTATMSLGTKPTAEERLAALEARNAKLEADLALAAQEKALTEKAATAGQKKALLDAAQADGRLLPAMRGDADAYADAVGSDVPRLERWLDGLKPSLNLSAKGKSSVRPLDASNETATKGDAQVARRIGVSTAAMDVAAEVHHFTGDGKVVMQDGSEKTLAALQKEFAQ